MVTTIRGKTRRNRRTIIGAALLALSLAALPAASVELGAPASPPAPGQTRSTTQPSAELTTLVNQLADGDSLVREKSREALMGLGSQDLPVLRATVAALSDRLLPSQKIYLREIVRQVFLSGLAYPTDEPALPFVGVRWNTTDGVMSFEAGDGPQIPVRATGLLVELRVPGFEAFRMLRDGDLVLGIDGIADDPTLTAAEFSDAMRTRFHPGDTVTLRVARNGQVLHVPIKLAPKPSNLPLGVDLSPWTEPREEEAETYWKSTFRPVVKDDGPVLSWGAF